MRRRTLLIGGAAALAVPLIAAPILLAPGADVPPSPEPPSIDPEEHARTIAAMRPPKRERPVIAIVAFNAATEVTDLLGPFNVLARAGVADVFIVAEQATPVQLYPVSKFGLGPMLFSVDPQMTMQAFDQRWPEGADYVIVPAIDPRDAAPVTGWINGLYKAEVIHRRAPWRSLEAVEFATLEWVHWFNNRRLLSSIGNMPPAEAEARYYASLEELRIAA